MDVKLVGTAPRSRSSTSNRRILANAGSLVLTIAVTSGLGFIYWWLAARLFSPAALGFASAIISATTLLGTMGMLGIGTLLVGVFPRYPGAARGLIVTALLVTGTVGSAVGLLFAVVAPLFSTGFRPLTRDYTSITLFAVGVGLTAMTLVLDQALIGLLRGYVQLGRNTVFSVTKLGALWVVGAVVFEKTGLTIYVTWVVGNVLSLAVLAAVALRRGGSVVAYRPRWMLLRGMGRAALLHHALNLVLLAPSLLLPLLVTVILSTSTNASFYVAWMIASFVFVIPASFANVLYAAGAAAPAALAIKMRFTMRSALVAGLLAAAAVALVAHPVLHLFGKAYAGTALGSLRILVLAVVPITVKDHYVTIARLHGRIARATVLIGTGGVLEVILATVGGHTLGLTGLSLGWVAAGYIEAIVLAPAVIRVAMRRDDRVPASRGDTAPADVGRSAIRSDG